MYNYYNSNLLPRLDMYYLLVRLDMYYLLARLDMYYLLARLDMYFEHTQNIIVRVRAYRFKSLSPTHISRERSLSLRNNYKNIYIYTYIYIYIIIIINIFLIYKLLTPLVD